ncbi:hypothetical protein [Lactobacillus melliventris]|uniref:Uncharacterized protein n=1 Tax=Lactobacillus melliventris TaxID=1218507 RepID=A0ABX5N2E2_9LACO|nr:hypothetical protein [Lactobacillus melliventris]PXY85280.1 hypothetical protein DK873_09130 [Lactobacillus melliventris]
MFFNTVLTVLISSPKKYRVAEKFIKSPLFIEIDQDEIYAAALLQHVRAIDPTVRMKGNIKVSLDEANMKKLAQF